MLGIRALGGLIEIPICMNTEGPQTTRRKILVVVPQLLVGGTELHLLRVLPALDRRTFQVSVFTTQGPGELDAAFREAGLSVISGTGRLPGRIRGILSGLPLVALLRRMRPDVVHFFLPEAYLVGGLAALLTGQGKRVMSRRSLNHYSRARPFVRWLESRLHRRMHAVVGNSRAVLDELTAEGVPPQRLGLIRNGIEAARFAQVDRATARGMLQIPEASLVLAMVASLLPYKGHADLLEALGRVRERLPEGWLPLVAGRDAGLEAGLRARAEALGIGGRIRWLGEVADVPTLLQAADLGLLCSHEEGFPNAVLEGMAAGLPMIVTDVGGCPEAVQDGVTGRVVPPRDPAALGDAIAELAAAPESRAAMGAAGQNRVAAEFSMEACVAGYERLYHAVLAEKPGNLAERLAAEQSDRIATQADTG